VTDPASIADRSRPRTWVDDAVRLIAADARRSADTHLLRYPLPSAWCDGVDVQLYLKDETTHITGSLKHRLARSLFLYALCNGRIGENTTVIEASSGSTAVSEAYFAAMLGLPFIAVMPSSTSSAKIALIESQGGRCHFVEKSSQVYAEAERLAEETGGHYLDQFTNAEAATDWRGNNNIAESIFEQLREEQHPIPEWIVVGAGTGGTSATIGRFIRYRRHATRLCVVDPENSAFFPAYAQGRRDVVTGVSHRGHRQAARRAVVPARRGGPDGGGAGCRIGCGGPSRQRGAGTPRGPVDGHERVGGFRPAGRDGGAEAQWIGGDAARRQWRPLRGHLLQSGVADPIRAERFGAWRRVGRVRTLRVLALIVAAATTGVGRHEQP
jgi:cysteine synthase